MNGAGVRIRAYWPCLDLVDILEAAKPIQRFTSEVSLEAFKANEEK